MTETVLNRIEAALDAALTFDPNVAESPIALLWPDKGKQWESVISDLQVRRRVVQYGAFDAELRRGPAYWLRCVIASTVEVEGAPEGTPVIYLPGVSRDDLRTIESAPAELAPLAGLQHRSQWFSHPNGRDWTVKALFSSKAGGLGLNVASDEATAEALVACLGHLADQPLARLEAKHIDAPFLNGLLNPDPVRSLLNWLDDPQAMRADLDDSAWSAFIQQCKIDFGFDPATKGELEGARRLGEAEGEWARAWQRFVESPADYPGIPDRLREAQPAELILENPGAWPQVAADAEEKLRGALQGLADRTAQEARDRILQCEVEHKARRSYVWAELGRTPLVLALEHLAAVAAATAAGPAGTSVQAIADWYADTGWRVDGAALAALNEVSRKVDVDAVGAALSAVYRPWLDAAAVALQGAVGPEANSGNYAATPAPTPADGTAVMFIDGLRLDVAHLLADRLAGAGLEANLTTGFAALPTVTQTSKPALVPIDQARLGAGPNLDARREPDGPPAGVQVLRALMAEAEVQVLGSHDVGDPGGRSWTEAGEIDHLGHDLGARVVLEIDDQVQRIAGRVEELIEGGWSTVTIVTDHGWLLLPGGLPKNEALPVGVTETKKGRCARIKDGADVSVPTVPWHWDHGVRIAVAPGISCFEANQTYEHGGVSPQECVVPRMSVRRASGAATSAVVVTATKWRGLTLVVEFTGLPEGATIDLRSSAGDASSSIAEMARVTGGDGKIFLMVSDEDLEGQPATLVIVSADGALLHQRATTVGQNR